MLPDIMVFFKKNLEFERSIS
ncbi:MAG: hypothetical protein ACD_28C00127G0001, partial [uncultured bacterium]